jgi:hypothetical protein
MEYEIWFRSKLTVGATHAYAETAEKARALVLHHLNAGRYDYAAVYGPEGGQAIFRARRWFSPYFAAVVDSLPAPAVRLRAVPQGVNPYEFAGRVAKARKLAEALRTHGISQADALLMDEAIWKLAAMGAGVSAPSMVTQMMAIEDLGWMESVAGTERAA